MTAGTVKVSENPLALGNLECAQARAVLDGREGELLVARDDDGARDGRQVSRLAALLVVLHEFVDLAADDVALVRLLARRNPALQQVPVDLRHGASALAASDRRLVLFAVAQHLETDQLVDVARRERRLVELNAELLHSNGRNTNHCRPCSMSNPGFASTGIHRRWPILRPVSDNLNRYLDASAGPRGGPAIRGRALRSAAPLTFLCESIVLW
jgi:hypothetical protein